MKFSLYIIFSLLIFISLSFQSNKNPKDFGNWKQYSASIGGMYAGSVDRNKLRSIYNADKIEPPKTDKGCTVKIKSYTFLHVHLKALPVYCELVESDKLTGTIKGKIGSSRPADYIIFDNIIAECSQTKKPIQLPSVVFNYNDTIPAKF